MVLPVFGKSEPAILSDCEPVINDVNGAKTVAGPKVGPDKLIIGLTLKDPVKLGVPFKEKLILAPCPTQTAVFAAPVINAFTEGPTVTVMIYGVPGQEFATEVGVTIYCTVPEVTVLELFNT